MTLIDLALIEAMRDELAGWPIGSGYYSDSVRTTDAIEMVEALVPIITAALQGREQWQETLRNDGTYEYTTTGDCHGTIEHHLRRRPAVAAGSWEPVEAIAADARYPHEEGA